MKEFTRQELEQFNGRNGLPAYIAHHGAVYDVSGSKMWRNGQHMRRHDAGGDLTEALAQAPHGPGMFERVVRAGVLKSDAAPAARPAPEVPAWAQWLLGFHPHPIMVHFPQAFLSFAPLFLVLFYVTGNTHFERTGFYMLACGAAMAVPTIATGFLHWIYKYARASGGIYKFKIILSLIVLCFACATVYVHAARGPLPPGGVDATVLALYLMLVPMIVALGHAGGMIVFGARK